MFYSCYIIVRLNGTVFGTGHASSALRRFNSNYPLGEKFCTYDIFKQKLINKEFGEKQQVLGFKNSLAMTAI